MIETNIAQLQPDPNNARFHGDRNLEVIQHSLKTYGQVEPLIVWKGGPGMIVLGGNGRLEAMKRLGWKTAWIRLVDLTEPEAMALALALNRTGELAHWDQDQLDKAIQQIRAEQDPSLIGFSEPELAGILGDPMGRGDLGGQDGDQERGGEFQSGSGGIRQILLSYEKAEFLELMEKAEKIAKAEGVESVSEVVLKLVERNQAGTL